LKFGNGVVAVDAAVCEASAERAKLNVGSETEPPLSPPNESASAPLAIVGAEVGPVDDTPPNDCERPPEPKATAPPNGDGEIPPLILLALASAVAPNAGIIKGGDLVGSVKPKPKAKVVAEGLVE